MKDEKEIIENVKAPETAETAPESANVKEKTFKVIAKNATRKDETNRTIYVFNLKSPVKYVNGEDAVADTRLVYISWFEIIRCLTEKPGFTKIQNALYGRMADGTIDPKRPSEDVRDIIGDAVLTLSQQEVVVGQIIVDPITGQEEDNPCGAHSVRTYLHDIEFGEEGLEVWNEIKELAKEARKSRVKFD